MRLSEASYHLPHPSSFTAPWTGAVGAKRPVGVGSKLEIKPLTTPSLTLPRKGEERTLVKTGLSALRANPR